MKAVPRVARAPLIGGALAASIFLFTLWLVGRVGEYEARVLLESSLSTIRFLSSTTATAAATILALMLTLLSLGITKEMRFRPVYYEGIKRVSLYSTACLTISIMLLIMLVVPLEESSEVTGVWYRLLYYGIIVVSATLGGLMVTIMLMLYGMIAGLISVVHPDEESYLVEDEAPR